MQQERKNLLQGPPCLVCVLGVGDSSTPRSGSHPVPEMSLKSAGLFCIFLLAAEGWSSPLNVDLWQKAAVSQLCWCMAAAVGVQSCFSLTYWDHRVLHFSLEFSEMQNLELIRCDQREETKVSSLQLFQWQPTGCNKRARVRDRVNLDAEKQKLENEIFYVAQLQYPRLY